MSTLFVCVTCRPADGVWPTDQPRPGARFYASLKEAGEDIDVVPVECLSNCTRSCSAAVTAPGKWTYIVGNLDPDLHVADVLQFARLHKAHEQGLPAWRERPDHVRRNTIARVPPMIIPGVVK